MSFIRLTGVVIPGWPALLAVVCERCGRQACCYAFNTTSAQVVRRPGTGGCHYCAQCQEQTCVLVA